MLNHKKLAMGFTLMATAAIPLACASMASARALDASKMEAPRYQNVASSDMLPQTNAVGGAYLITWYQGLPGRREHAVHLTASDIDDIGYLENVCRAEIKPQQPGFFSSVGYTTVTMGLGTAIGLAGGAKGAFGAAVSASSYGIYGGVEGGVAGFVGGIDIHDRSKRGQYGQCMINMVDDAQRAGDMTRGIHANILLDVVEGNKIARPAPSNSDVAPQNGPPAPEVGEHSSSVTN
jgi:hypothetical protein